MITSHSSNPYPDGCEITIPIVLKVPIFLQPTVLEKQEACLSQFSDQVAVGSSTLPASPAPPPASNMLDRTLVSESKPQLEPEETIEPNSRVFLYEVSGLRQETNTMNCPIRRSGSLWLTVPFNRMNQIMQWIARMGGKIVRIKPIGSSAD